MKLFTHFFGGGSLFFLKGDGVSCSKLDRLYRGLYYPLMWGLISGDCNEPL